MLEIAADRLGDDGRLLILRDTVTGTEYAVPVDEARAVLGAADRVPPGRTEPPMPHPTGPGQTSSLSPRDIQSRIRRGESVAQVADAAGVPVSRIEGFATPVLAERAYMAEQAQGTSIRRRHASGPGIALGAAVDQEVARRGVPQDDVTWDAWRREDGRWTVTVDVRDQVAAFVFDHRSRYVVPADEVAHELVGDVALPEQTDMAIADALRHGEEPGAPAPTTEAEQGSSGPTEDVVEDVVEQTDPEAAVEEPVAPEPAGASVRSLAEARDRRAQEQELARESAAATPPPAQPSFDDLDELDLFSSQDSEPQRQDLPDAVAVNESPVRKKKHERRRVPSWDEIMFGGRED